MTNWLEVIFLAIRLFKITMEVNQFAIDTFISSSKELFRVIIEFSSICINLAVDPVSKEIKLAVTPLIAMIY